jgi:hypothetical protein
MLRSRRVIGPHPEQHAHPPFGAASIVSPLALVRVHNELSVPAGRLEPDGLSREGISRPQIHQALATGGHGGH